MITILVFGSSILHTGIPDTVDETLVYPDIIYPTHIIPGYQLLQVDAPDDLDITLYYYTGNSIALINPPVVSTDQISVL